MGLGSGNIKVNVNAQLSVTGTLPEAYLDGAPVSGRQFKLGTEDGWRLLGENFDDNNTPTPLQVLAMEITIAGGAVDVDLSAAEIVGALSGGDPANTEDLDGLKCMGFILSTLGQSNAAAVVVAPKADATGYEGLFGASKSDGVEVPNNALRLYWDKDSGGIAVDNAGRKVITCSGTNGDILNLLLLFE